MLGLDAAGKTTTLYKLKLNETVTTTPTLGFNVETVKILNKVNFTVWDVAGQDRVRPLWRHYFRGSEGLIFVLDSHDRQRVPEAKEELHAIIRDSEMKGVPVVVFANKQDLPGAISVDDIVERMELKKMSQRDWQVQATCATTGDGLLQGIEVMNSFIKEFRKRKK